MVILNKLLLGCHFCPRLHRSFEIHVRCIEDKVNIDLEVKPENA